MHQLEIGLCNLHADEDVYRAFDALPHDAFLCRLSDVGVCGRTLT